jgi:hypothetical protein
MGSVGLLLIYHIFDVIRERIAHMDDGEKDWTTENWEAQEVCFTRCKHLLQKYVSMQHNKDIQT